jgi:hypothetical protein
MEKHVEGKIPRFNCSLDDDDDDDFIELKDERC